MSNQHVWQVSRRKFLRGLTLAGTAGFLGLQARKVGAEPPPETTTLRLGQTAALCFGAPQYVAEELLHAEGFHEVQYIKGLQGASYKKALASGEIHFGIHFAGESIVQIDAGEPILLLTGLHVGCFELFGTDRVHTLRDLKGKTAAVTALGTGRHVFLTIMLASIGLDPQKD